MCDLFYSLCSIQLLEGIKNNKKIEIDNGSNSGINKWIN